ncbi:hypothetical protein [Actinomadura spongiicola]|uniref:hypothetical protein n=1 Tax=Actinomadura spongiicola TaxID=2303421 RepID=UPI0011C0CF79|nr:hypothetical protein [Actinomadura spongiicola]
MRNVLTKVWERWQLEVLRMRFPSWDIARIDHDVWRVTRPPVTRIIVGRINTAREEMAWLDDLFANGLLLHHPRRP